MDRPAGTATSQPAKFGRLIRATSDRPIPTPNDPRPGCSPVTRLARWGGTRHGIADQDISIQAVPPMTQHGWSGPWAPWKRTLSGAEQPAHSRSFASFGWTFEASLPLEARKSARFAQIPAWAGPSRSRLPTCCKSGGHQNKAKCRGEFAD